MRFDGKVVLVTGAAHGIGAAVCRRFVAMGAAVHACDVAPIEAMEGVVASRVDLVDRAAAAAWVEGVGRAADVVVLSAGGVAGQEGRPIEEVGDGDWDRVFAVNVDGAFAVCRAAVPGMKRAGGGRIVTISSGAGLQASLTGIQAYCAAKHAVVGLTRQLAHELGPFGITVNSVAPGLVLSNPSTERQWAGYGEAGQRAIVERIALRRLGTADDIAGGVIFFASELAGFVSGQILQVDGGR